MERKPDWLPGFPVQIYCNSGVRAIISYEPLWKTLQEKGISQYYLLQNGLDNKTLDSLKKGKNITLLTLEKLCKLIDCTPNDIIEFI